MNEELNDYVEIFGEGPSKETIENFRNTTKIVKIKLGEKLKIEL